MEIKKDKMTIFLSLRSKRRFLQEEYWSNTQIQEEVKAV